MDDKHAEHREKKYRKNRYGMQVSNRSIKTIVRKHPPKVKKKKNEKRS